LYQDTGFEDSNGLEFPLIHPKSVLRTIWNPILALLMLYTATLLPYRCIQYLKILVGFEVSTEKSLGWIIFDNIIDILYWGDLVMNMLSTYYDEDGKLVRKRKDVLLNYLKGWFIIDLLACLPMDLIFEAIWGTQKNSSKVRLVKLAKIPRLYRLI
jgi:hypothetical protein